MSDHDADPVIKCWCGAEGPHDELFSLAPYAETCGGTGYIPCFCGGDGCCCHHHGGIECDGCDDCAEYDDEYEEFWDAGYD